MEKKIGTLFDHSPLRFDKERRDGYLTELDEWDATVANGLEEL